MVARTNAEDRGLNRQSSIRPWVVMKIYLANKDSNKHFPYTLYKSMCQILCNQLGIILLKNSKCAQCYFQASLLHRIREFPLLKIGKANGLFAIAVDMEAEKKAACPVKHHTWPACCPFPWKCSKPQVHYRDKIDTGPNKKGSRPEP